MPDLPTIPLPITLPRRATYQRHVILEGHRAGVLSGAELRGRANRYGARYAMSRAAVQRLVVQHGIRQNLCLVNSRWCRVWTKGGKPVKLTLQNNG